MNSQKTVKTLIFMLALTMLMPAVQLIGTPDAAAFGILSSSRKSGKREHKQSDKKKSDKRSKRSNATSQAVRSPSNSRARTNTRSNTRTDTRSRTTYRSAPTTTTQRRTVYRTEPSRTTTRSRTTYRTQPRTTTTTRRRVYTNSPRTTYRNRGRVVHRRHYVAPAPRRTVTRTEVHHHHVAPAPRTVTRTEIHHHSTGSPAVVRRRSSTQRYYYGSGDTSGGSTVTGTYNRSNRSFGADNGGDVTEAYITAGAGVSGFAANQISNDALPGMGFNVGLGAKSGWLAGELGFNMSGYRLDPAQTQSDMALMGVSADLKLQPSFAFLEPYALVGVGGEYFSDSVANQSASGGALRLGAGLDVRIDNVALSAQYLYTQHGLFGAEGSAYTDNLLTAQTETIGVGIKLYF